MIFSKNLIYFCTIPIFRKMLRDVCIFGISMTNSFIWCRIRNLFGFDLFCNAPREQEWHVSLMLSENYLFFLMYRNTDPYILFHCLISRERAALWRLQPIFHAFRVFCRREVLGTRLIFACAAQALRPAQWDHERLLCCVPGFHLRV